MSESPTQRYQRLHPEEYAQSKADFYARNPGYSTTYARNWREKNRERYLSHARGVTQKLREEARERVLLFFGECCCKCGFADKRALHLDHINGDGYLETSDSRRRWTIIQVWQWVQKFPEEALKKYQLLCANCNSIKAYEQHEWTQNKLVSVIQEGGASLALNRTGKEGLHGRTIECD